MKNILKLTGVSMLAIAATTNANAAGYTCESLIQYESCNPGYYLHSAECDGTLVYGACEVNSGEYFYGLTKEECLAKCNEFAPCYAEDEYVDWSYEEFACMGNYDLDGDYVDEYTVTCDECPAGYYCEGGIKSSVACAAGTYQPNKIQASCIDAPAGNYVSKMGATSYTACAAGTYQPSAGSSSCVECPAGSYCAGTGLTAVSGQCTAGTFAFAGASVCYTCPEHEYTNASGQTVSVPATTVPETGADSIASCVIDSTKTFTDIKGEYRFKENCAYDIPTFEEACLAYQQANPDMGVDCNTSDPDYWPYCFDGMGTLVYDETTGAIGCHDDGGSACGGDIELEITKTNCALTGGVYNPNTTFCECPSGTTWACNDAGYSDELDQEWGCFNM